MLDQDDLRAARLAAHLTHLEAARLCGLHRSSYTRQESGHTGRVSGCCVALLRLHGGQLPGDWEGWRLTDDRLFSPEGYPFTPGDLQAHPYLYQQIANYQRLLREAENEKAHRLTARLSRAFAVFRSG